MCKFAQLYACHELFLNSLKLVYVNIIHSNYKVFGLYIHLQTLFKHLPAPNGPM
jgi:hypothetical protein